jgi:hypothetical protein
MDEKAHGDSPWSIDGSRAQLSTGQLSAELDMARPHAGLNSISLGGRKLSAELLCVHRIADTIPGHAPAASDNTGWPLSVADAYVRGSDLVVAYAANSDWPFAPQVYWHAGVLDSVADVLGSISLLVSVQTHLLDTWPRIGIRSQMACDELLQVTAGGGRPRRAEIIEGNHTFSPATTPRCIVYRLKDVPVSYVEIMPANDYRDVKVQQDAKHGGCVDWELFSEFLEKGVIRRARLHSALVPRENDVEIAAACCDAIERCALPLTT